tara:strand:+ start:11684 stop:12124 length:441 start_codon:yes stop_codon:yes gene_type:complete
VHQSPISVNGWQGSGYSVLDPETGVGAYQISGGASGGALGLSDAWNSNLFWTLTVKDLTEFIVSFFNKAISAFLSLRGAFNAIENIQTDKCVFSGDWERYLAITLVITFLFVALMSVVVAMPLFFQVGFSLIGLLFAEEVDASCQN